MDAQIYAYRWPFLRPLTTATTVATSRQGYLVRLLWPDGLVGCGEAASWPNFGAGPAAVAAWQLPLAAAMRSPGAALPSPATLHAPTDLVPPPQPGAPQQRRLPSSVRQRALAWVATGLAHLQAAIENHPARPTAASLPPEWQNALEVALLDAAGRALGVPMAALLAAAPAASLPLHAQIGSASEAVVAKAAGATAFKVKIGRRALDDELGHLAGIRSAIGQAAELRLDVNGAWPRPVAERAMLLLTMVEPAWLEQPLQAGDVAGLAALRRLGTIPIAVDEGLSGYAATCAHLAAQAADVYVLKPMYLGGPSKTLQVAEAALAAGCDVQVTHAMESNFGCLAALQTAAAVASLPAARGLPGRVRAHGLRPMLAHEPHLFEPSCFGLAAAAALAAREAEKVGPESWPLPSAAGLGWPSTP